MIVFDKSRLAAFLATAGRRLARPKTPLRPLVLWLWRKTAFTFLD